MLHKEKKSSFSYIFTSFNTHCNISLPFFLPFIDIKIDLIFQTESHVLKEKMLAQIIASIICSQRLASLQLPIQKYIEILKKRERMRIK